METLPKSQSEAMAIPSRTFLQDSLPQLLGQIGPDAQRQWGITPSVQHIMEHISAIVYISRKDVGLSLSIPEDKVEKAQKWIFREGSMMRRGTKAPLDNIVKQELRYASLDESKDILLMNIAAFYGYFSENKGIKLMHPAFGPLDLEAWERFHHIHIVHHLGQFSALEADMSAEWPAKK
ncbi:MAG: DUF1569 domain-containing protein [Bacteroidota bacterium]